MEDLKRQYLIKKKNSEFWYFRIRVPDYCQAFYGNKKYMIKSLKEIEQKKAQFKANEIAAKYLEEFAKFKATKDYPLNEQQYCKLIDEYFLDLYRSTAAYIYDLNAQGVELTDHVSPYDDQLQLRSVEYGVGGSIKNEDKQVYPEFLEFLRENYIYHDNKTDLKYAFWKYSKSDIDYFSKVIKLYDEAMYGGMDKVIAVMEEHYKQKEKVEGVSKIIKLNKLPQKVSLYDALASYDKDFNQQRNAANRSRFDMAMELLKSYFSGNPTFADITRDDLRKLAKTIHLLPNYQYGRNLLKVPVRQFMEQKYKKEYTKISAKTAKYRVSCITSIFEKIYKEYKSKYNLGSYDGLADNLSEFVDKSNKSSKKNITYTIEELNKLLSDEHYLDYANNPYDKCGALFWGTLIAIFNGPRVGEIAQLNLQDIVINNGILCISIDDETYASGQKSVKNDNSNRLIPVNKIVCDLGLVDFVEYIRDKHGDNSDLFPILVERGNVITDAPKNLGKDFSKLIKKQKWSKEGHTFHSFRHVFKTAIDNSDPHIPEEITKVLGGWSKKSLSKDASKNYGLGFNAKKLSQYLSYADYSGLEYRHLKVSFGGNRSARVEDN